MSKEPYIDFYTGDWLKDQAVSRCAPATRGIWIDLLCAMHDDARSGRLCGTAEELARLARCQPAELSTALTSLQITGAADVTERHGVFTVINRRMYRIAQDREKSRLRQRKHREGKEVVTDEVTVKSRGDPPDSDSDSDIFLLPDALNCDAFRLRLEEWLRYKSERRESYKKTGMAAMVSLAAKRASTHGLQAVMDAMERAIANRWAGWDHPSSFPGAVNGRKQGPGQSHDPTAARNPNHGRM